MKKILSLIIALTLLAFVAIPAHALESTDLVGWWKLDNNKNDSSHSGFNGTLVGDALFANIDNLDAVKFDGDGDYIYVENDDALNFSNALTVEGWIRLNSIGAGKQATIAGKWNDLSVNNRGYLLTVNASGQASFYISSTGSDFPKAMWNEPLSLNTWYHLAGTYDGTHIKLYVDGQEKDSTEFTSDINSNTEQLLIGANDGYGGTVRKYTDGYIRDVRIWEVALKQSELMILNPLDIDNDGVADTLDCDPTNPDVSVLVGTKSCQLYRSGVTGKGILTAPGLQKPFNENSSAHENAGKKKN